MLHQPSKCLTAPEASPPSVPYTQPQVFRPLYPDALNDARVDSPTDLTPGRSIADPEKARQQPQESAALAFQIADGYRYPVRTPCVYHSTRPAIVHVRVLLVGEAGKFFVPAGRSSPQEFSGNDQPFWQ